MGGLSWRRCPRAPCVREAPQPMALLCNPASPTELRRAVASLPYTSLSILSCAQQGVVLEQQVSRLLIFNDLGKPA